MHRGDFTPRAVAGLALSGQAMRYVHGRWQRPRIIDPIKGMVDISCPTSGYCVALSGHGRVTTFEHGSWSEPMKVTQLKQLAIDCVSPGHCVSVGDGGNMILDGPAWTQVPGVGSRHTVLVGVDCVDEAFCVAGGPVVVEFHAGVWSRLPFVAVVLPPSCASRNLCVIAGQTKNHHVVEETVDGAAVRRSPSHHAGVVSCAPGPLCIELTRYSALVGSR